MAQTTEGMLSEQIDALRKEISSLSSRLSDHLGKNLSGATDDALASTKDAVNVLAEGAREHSQRAVQYARENPGTALAWASVGLVALVACMLMKGRGSRYR
ncbi:hypothetical protein [Brucella intermedia]|uniref:hypothetical protein n=1 Tax=Brucella intermedia TaxID=94625 RepID=UPI0021C93CC7|nr:hypothetical protein [Brucella intermedia]UXO85657.1 hypothetical protein N8I72_14940 [Brucella intermedia]